MEINKFFKNLFIFEMANNHSGDLSRGIEIIRQISEAVKKFDFQFAFKFQYRNMETFIHPDFKGRDDIKYVKRFSETALKEEDFLRLKKEAENRGFITVCTPFDEESVDNVVKHKYDILKIASCSFTDWPLLEKIAETNLPIIASTAGATLEEIDRVVSFFEHRRKNLCVMHCVGEYPTKRENLQLNQIDLLKSRYPEAAVGFSTHEEPDNFDSIKIALAKGAKVFERHVAVENKKFPANAYSSTPAQIAGWLEAAASAIEMMGAEGDRHPISQKEKNDLRGLKRGVFAKEKLQKGEKLSRGKIFFAIPCAEKQLVANDISKYMEYTMEKDIEPNKPISFDDVNAVNLREKVLKIIKELKEIIIKSHIALPNKVDLELSHHYGIDRYEEWGAAILNCINREYCKKLIILLPGQKHPYHYHVKKEETFHVLYGSMEVDASGNRQTLEAGDMMTVERNVNHNFSSKNGCIFEEVSTTHYKNDSFYQDEEVMKNKDRKTAMTFWSDWLYKSIK